MTEQCWIFPEMADAAVSERRGPVSGRVPALRDRPEGVPRRYDGPDSDDASVVEVPMEVPERRSVRVPVTRASHASDGGVELRPAGTLVDRVVERLVRGSMTTAEIADEVLRLRGNPRAAAAAVYTLLGSDPRVKVDGSGVWSLADAPVEPAVEIAELEWVVVDVETTGGWPSRGHRIIEVAAVHVSRGQIVGEYTTLVNPRRPIPSVITSLTGITNDDVAGAPYFEEVVSPLTDALEGRVFVGHNAGFDWHFVSSEMQRCTGRALSGRRLCTLRLARRLFPHLPSRSLGSLARYLGIEMAVHHRALDDAVATAELLIRFLELLAEQEVTDWASLETFLRRRPRGLRRKRRARPAFMERA